MAAVVYTLPTGIWTRTEFTLDPKVKGNRTRGATVPRLGSGTPYWSVIFETKPLDNKEWYDLRGWYDGLVGGAHLIEVHDFGLTHPQHYFNGTNGWGAYGGSANVSALNGRTITVDAALGNMVVKRGDVLNLIEGGNRQYHRVIEDVNLDANGDGIITVAPAPFTTLFTIAATIMWLRPHINVILDPGSWKGKQPAGSAVQSVTFTATQDVPR